MCGRFVMKADPGELADFFSLAGTVDVVARYNIAPTQLVAAVAGGPDGRAWRVFRWGLVPSWASDVKIGQRMINARSETVFDKPVFRMAIRRRRCLIPADGFYEWGTVGAVRQPYFIRLNDSRPFAMGGIWEHWESPEGDVIESCAILTAPANELMSSFHHRMPVIIDRDQFDRWLDPAVTDRSGIEDLLAPYPSERMACYPVSRLVDNPRHDQPSLIEPTEQER
jgi:putative SOS response-associated peptidase YedK